MRVFTLFILLIAFNVLSLGQTMPKGADPVLWQKALRIHKAAFVVDGHNDITSPMVDEDFDLGTDSRGKYHKDGDPFHTDISRLRAGGITGEFFSIYVSGSTLKTGGAMRRAMDLIDATYREVERHPKALSMCTTAADIRNAKRQGKVCVLMGIEGGYAIENSLYALRDFYRLGIRYMTLTHNVSHDWADAHGDVPKNNGLSEFGKEVVREMNRVGMMIDVSHISDESFYDVLAITKAPVIASHSSCRALCENPRNINDDMLQALKKNGGVIQICILSDYLRQPVPNPEYDAQMKELRDKWRNMGELTEAQQEQRWEEISRLREQYVKLATIGDAVNHIQHVIDVIGIDYVGIGSDFDGGGSIEGCTDASMMKNITNEMIRRGYNREEIAKIWGGNFMRVMNQVQAVSNQQSAVSSLQ